MRTSCLRVTVPSETCMNYEPSRSPILLPPSPLAPRAILPPSLPPDVDSRKRSVPDNSERRQQRRFSWQSHPRFAGINLFAPPRICFRFVSSLHVCQHQYVRKKSLVSRDWRQARGIGVVFWIPCSFYRCFYITSWNRFCEVQ